MEFITLKNNRKGKYFFCGIVCVVVLLVVVTTFTRARYRTTQSIQIVEGEINYKVPDFNMVALYVANESGEYIEADVIPTSGYTLNREQSYCGQSQDGEIIKDETVNFIYENGSMTFSNVTKKGTKCYLYFDKIIVPDVSAKDMILAEKRISDIRSTSITDILIGDEDKDSSTLYTTEDDWGTSYFFAGLPNNNWVSFGGFYWRIIRINGDGSIRMIYNGTTIDQTGTGTQIQTSVYNSPSNDNTYIGYMYGSTGASSYNATHTNTNDSTIKGILDKWYKDNLANYSQYLSTEVGFCNDREVYTEISWANYTTLGYGTNATTYVPASRFSQWTNGDSSWKTTATPILKCS